MLWYNSANKIIPKHVLCHMHDLVGHTELMLFCVLHKFESLFGSVWNVSLILVLDRFNFFFFFGFFFFFLLDCKLVRQRWKDTYFFVCSIVWRPNDQSSITGWYVTHLSPAPFCLLGNSSENSTVISVQLLKTLIEKKQTEKKNWRQSRKKNTKLKLNLHLSTAANQRK